MSLKKSLFTKATVFPEDTGAVEDIQVGISTVGHLPKIVLRVAASAEHAFQNAATPYHGGLLGKSSFDLNLRLNIIAAFSSRKKYLVYHPNPLLILQEVEGREEKMTLIALAQALRCWLEYLQ